MNTLLLVEISIISLENLGIARKSPYPHSNAYKITARHGMTKFLGVFHASEASMLSKGGKGVQKVFALGKKKSSQKCALWRKKHWSRR